jgi:hypothetical protein
MRRPLDPPEGVLWHQSSASDLLFITLGKSEAPPSPPPPAPAAWPSAPPCSTGRARAAQAGHGHRAVCVPRSCAVREP